jgi:hypothetical protein
MVFRGVHWPSTKEPSVSFRAALFHIQPPYVGAHINCDRSKLTSQMSNLLVFPAKAVSLSTGGFFIG